MLKRILAARRRPEPSRYIIVVSGLPRSGTSMMMNMLQAGGVALVTDDERAADDDNPRGYFELERVKALAKGDSEWVADAQGKAIKVISALLKDLPAEYHYRVVFVRRNMAEILASQRRMLENRGEATDRVPDDKLAGMFRRHLAEVEAWLGAQPNFEVLYVDYNAMVADPAADVAAVTEFLGGGLDTAAMCGVVDPALHRQRRVPGEPMEPGSAPG